MVEGGGGARAVEGPDKGRRWAGEGLESGCKGARDERLEQAGAWSGTCGNRRLRPAADRGEIVIDRGLERDR